MQINETNQNKLSGRYEIIEQIGVGGMSYVYKALDIKRKKIVAIKILKDELSLDDEFVSKFKSEALACKDIKHDNVISAIDVVDEGKMHYIVMEYMNGTTLNKYIKSKGKLTNEEVVQISLQVAKGIRAAHEKGIIHRDIKPQNIVIDDNGVAKITDFGIARAITSTTRNISVVGTVHYISPEQVRNTKIDFRSDIYSFGCTMYEMITGVVPFEGEAPLEIVIAHLRENLKAPHLVVPDIYKSLEKIILKASRMVPRERYQDMNEMISDLEKALADKEGTYISDTNYDDDEEGKTVIISDEDMKVIKAVSEKLTNRNSYKNEKNEDLTPEQREFFDRYIKNGGYKQHILLRRLVVIATICIALLACITIIITLDTRKASQNPLIATGSIVLGNIKGSLSGVNVEIAKNVASQYGIKFDIVGEEYSDTIGFGKILDVVENAEKGENVFDITLSKGSLVLDFTDLEELQNTKWVDMAARLNDRELKYKMSEINDIHVPRGYIIGASKKKSDEPGELIFTVSAGVSDQIKIMPDLYDKPITEARELLEATELILGNVSFVRDSVIEENRVIKQSVEKDKEVKSGTNVDLVLSCGPDGVEFVAVSKPKWYSSLSTTFKLLSTHIMNAESGESSLILEVRLSQVTANGTIYTELIEPTEYSVGTIIPLNFPEIEGEELLEWGQVQVVDVENDRVLASIDCKFWPNKE